MDEVIKLKAKSEEEVEKMAKNILHLKENETFEIMVVKKPKKILFLSIEGEYEIRVVDKKKKQEINEIKKAEKEAKAQTAKKEPVKEKEKVQEKPKEKRTQEKVIREPKKVKEPREIKEKPVQAEKPERKEPEGSIENQLRAVIKEFIVASKLNVSIKNIYSKNGRYIVNLEGKDIRYLIGEKGTTLNSLEYLIGTMVRNVKVVIDSNGYKNKREESLRALARKKGEKVLETGNSIKLNPMSARERKIIHEEISFMKDLETQSVGEEPKRCLVIKKKR
ncbi:R3H domain-containing nucleic acid-binding protein [Sebaldella sp. S0638]|uniref:Jag family protein n=1 Tax=Sebaldella sp. S0638 TaxID=2957809 RepID=UPI00209E3EC5|nr:R3H domain-containing nucleic acid-binding protein [Sebaldella sp. S0638]MCP1224371.1 single-stranded DNA-binding protein [Sebaldella sp. S0638]